MDQVHKQIEANKTKLTENSNTISTLRRVNHQLRDKIAPVKRENAKLKDEQELIVAEHKKLKSLFDKKMRTIGEMKGKITDLEQYKKKFVDEQDYETKYFINLRDDQAITKEQKIEFFFNKLMSIRSELRSIRVDYEKKRQLILERNEQQTVIEAKMKTIRDDKTALQKKIEDKDLKYESLLDKCTQYKERIKSIKNELNEYKRTMGLPINGNEERSQGYSVGFNNRVKNSLGRPNGGVLGQIKKSSNGFGFESYRDGIVKDSNEKEIQGPKK